jgi:uncharacterized membrane protein (Fun14 family)
VALDSTGFLADVDFGATVGFVAGTALATGLLAVVAGLATGLATVVVLAATGLTSVLMVALGVVSVFSMIFCSDYVLLIQNYKSQVTDELQIIGCKKLGIQNLGI